MQNYLTRKLGNSEGVRLYKLQQERLAALVSSIDGRSDTQRAKLTDTILPRIALYQILKEDAKYVDRAGEILDEYMLTVIAPESHAKMEKMEKVPFFFALYSNMYAKSLKSGDLWDAELIEKTRDHCKVDIKRCLWYDACEEHGCPELCISFCKCDEIIYNGLKKISFSRTQALGMGGEKCDFVFSKK